MSSLCGPAIDGKRSFSTATISAVSSTESVVCVIQARLSGSRGSKRARILHRLDQRDGARRKLAHRALHLRMAGMADEHDLAPAPVMQDRFLVHLGDERAGRVEDEDVARGRVLAARASARRAPRRRPGRPDSGISSSSSTKTAPFGLQALHHIAVVHDLVAHIDRGAEALERLLDDLDGALDAGAEAARGAEQDVELRAAHPIRS